MKDTPLSDYGGASFSSCVDELIKEVNYYMKSGYHTLSFEDLSAIKGIYDDLYHKIIYLKSRRGILCDIDELYKCYCKIKRELGSTYLIGVDIHGKIIGRDIQNCRPGRIQSLYHMCINILCQQCKTAGVSTQPTGDLFAKRSVFLGPLRSREQLGVCLAYNFYHIPVSKLDIPIESLTHIAIYQSKNFFGANAGIRYYGAISSYEIVSRSQISQIPKKSDELYYKIYVDSWKTLPHLIEATGGGNPFGTTSLYLLTRAKDIFELDFRQEGVYKLYLAIKKSIESKRTRVSCHWRNLTFAIDGDNLFVYRFKEKMYAVKTKDFITSPSRHFWKMIACSKTKPQY